jgi:hypothetical protein
MCHGSNSGLRREIQLIWLYKLTSWGLVNFDTFCRCGVVVPRKRRPIVRAAAFAMSLSLDRDNILVLVYLGTYMHTYLLLYLLPYQLNYLAPYISAPLRSYLSTYLSATLLACLWRQGGGLLLM